MQKGVIYQYHVEIETWKKNGSILMRFHRDAIAIFYQEHQKELERILVELKAMQSEFVEFENDEIKRGADGMGIFKEGKTAQTMEEAYMRLMSQETEPFTVHHKKPLAEA